MRRTSIICGLVVFYAIVRVAVFPLEARAELRCKTPWAETESYTINGISYTLMGVYVKCRGSNDKKDIVLMQYTFDTTKDQSSFKSESRTYLTCEEEGRASDYSNNSVYTTEDLMTGYKKVTNVHRCNSGCRPADYKTRFCNGQDFLTTVTESCNGKPCPTPTPTPPK